jgi:hypothetical protein
MSHDDRPAARWRTSSHSDGQANCVQVAAAGRVVAVRDSKSPSGPGLAFTPGAWRRFTEWVAAAQ